MRQRKRERKAQLNWLDEIIVDNFAGGGGASTGIELAIGRPVNIAVNHDPDAILMHKTNHPYTEHYCENVWNIDPVKVCAGRPVGLAWFSPDCKHFSKAKGGKPVDKNIRGLAWVVLRWAGTVRPRVVILENVEEFQTWGPVRKEKPVKKQAGQTFQRWLFQLRQLGYVVEWRELVAADYGAPTTRKRFFLVARCDGQSIVWPEPSHAPSNSAAVKTGVKKSWRSAAEIIDWTLPTPSIFATREEIKARYGSAAQRPLSLNTMCRIICGVDKFILKSPTPFIVSLDSEEVSLIGNNGGRSEIVTTPNLMAIGHTQVTKAEECFVCPTLIQYHSDRLERVRGQTVMDPLMTVDSSNRYGIAAVSLSKFYGGVVGSAATDPLPTITAIDHNAVQTAHLVKFKGTNLGSEVMDPVQTITAGGCHHGLVTTVLSKVVPATNLKNWPEIRTLLNTYCGYALKDNEVLLLQVAGIWYFMADIGLRMLTPRELYQAQGFPLDYKIERDYTGATYSKTKQVARCGNAVPPPFAKALVVANLQHENNDR